MSGPHPIEARAIPPLAAEIDRLRALNAELVAALEGFRLKPDAIVGSQGEDIILRVPIAAIQRAVAALAKRRPGHEGARQDDIRRW